MEYTLFNIAIIVLILDLIWIHFFLLDPFSRMIQEVQGSPMVVKPIAAFVAYFILILFIYLNLKKADNYYEAFLMGALLYGVYDSTNYATLTNWNLYIAIIDVIWGGILLVSTKYIIENF